MNPELLIQLLVDHELEPVPREQLLRRLPTRHPLWQSIALAFVEKQILDEQLGADSSVPAVPDRWLPEHGLPITNQEDAETAAFATSCRAETRQALKDMNGNSTRVVEPNRPILPRTSEWRSRWAISMTVAAAGLLFGFLLGQFRGEVPAPPGPESANSALDNQTNPSQVAASSLTDALARCSAPIPDEFRQDLLSAGYVLDEKEQMEQVPLPFGGTIDVPVRKYDIKYLGPSAFQ